MEHSGSALAQVLDGFLLFVSWDDKIAAAMRRCKQDKHLTKKGTLLGPLCSRILIRDSSGVHLLHSAPDRPALGGGAGHGGGCRGGSLAGRGGRGGRGGKENVSLRNGGAAAAAPGAAAQAAAAAGP